MAHALSILHAKETKSISTIPVNVKLIFSISLVHVLNVKMDIISTMQHVLFVQMEQYQPTEQPVHAIMDSSIFQEDAKGVQQTNNILMFPNYAIASQGTIK